MAGPPEGSEPQDPSEVFIVGVDGAHHREPVDVPFGRPADSGRRSAALAIAALLVFGLGVAVGTHLGTAPASTAGAPTATPPAGTTASPPIRPSASSPTGTRTGTDQSSTATVTPSWGFETRTSSAAPWPTAIGACDVDVPLPILSGVRALRATTGLELLAGSDTRPLVVDDATVGPPLFDLAQGEFVSQLAVDAAGAVAVISDCGGYPPVRVVRRSPNGHPHDIDPHRSGYQVGSLITGGDRTWLALFRVEPNDVSYTDGAVLLQSTDGSDETITLPNGFNPVAGSGDVIVGNWSDHLSSVYGPIQLYSVTRRGIVAQIGDATPQYAVGDGYIVWSTGDCAGSCLVHRYRIATGHQTTVPVTTTTRMFWQAISPDGGKVAAIVYGNPADPGFDTGHPSGPTRLAVVDLGSGTVTSLPGVEMAPKSAASMAFSNDGQWLVVAFNTGPGATVLLYDKNLDGPLAPPVGLPGPTLWSVPLAVVPTAG